MVHKIVKTQKKFSFIRNKYFYTGFFMASSYFFVYQNWNILRMAMFNEKTRKGSREVGTIAQMRVPMFMRSFLFGFYSLFYSVVVEDMKYPFSHYETVNEFFTREVKPRNITEDPNSLVSPADSKIISIQKIDEDQIIAVKGVNYSLGQFL